MFTQPCPGDIVCMCERTKKDKIKDNDTYKPFSIAAIGPQNSIVSFKKLLARQWYNFFPTISSSL